MKMKSFDHTPITIDVTLHLDHSLGGKHDNTIANYNLAALAIHQGVTSHAGHYNCVVFNASGQGLLFDDENQYSVSMESYLNSKKCKENSRLLVYINENSTKGKLIDDLAPWEEEDMVERVLYDIEQILYGLEPSPDDATLPLTSFRILASHSDLHGDIIEPFLTELHLDHFENLTIKILPTQYLSSILLNRQKSAIQSDGIENYEMLFNADLIPKYSDQTAKTNLTDSDSSVLSISYLREQFIGKKRKKIHKYQKFKEALEDSTSGDSDNDISNDNDKDTATVDPNFTAFLRTKGFKLEFESYVRKEIDPFIAWYESMSENANALLNEDVPERLVAGVTLPKKMFLGLALGAKNHRLFETFGESFYSMKEAHQYIVSEIKQYNDDDGDALYAHELNKTFGLAKANFIDAFLFPELLNNFIRKKYNTT